MCLVLYFFLHWDLAMLNIFPHTYRLMCPYQELCDSTDNSEVAFKGKEFAGEIWRFCSAVPTRTIPSWVDSFLPSNLVSWRRIEKPNSIKRQAWEILFLQRNYLTKSELLDLWHKQNGILCISNPNDNDYLKFIKSHQMKILSASGLWCHCSHVVASFPIDRMLSM